MFGAFVKAVSQLDDPAVRRVLLMGVAAALVIFVALWFAVGFLITETVLFQMVWLEVAIDVLGGLATGIITWLMFPAVVTAIVGIFLEDVADAVEARHYPDLAAAAGLPLVQSILTAAKFLGVMLVLNLLMLPFLLLPPVFPFVFYSVNGYLLSREYYELVALRRVNPADARRLRKAQGLRLFLAGVLIAFLLTVPVVNLVVPVVATAAMVHLFQTGPGVGARGPFGVGTAPSETAE